MTIDEKKKKIVTPDVYFKKEMHVHVYVINTSFLFSK